MTAPDRQKLENRETGPQKKTNYELLLKKLNELVLNGQLQDKHKKLLANPEVWQGLSVEKALEWSRICQVGGLTEEALEVLSWIHEQSPSFEVAWEEHRDLLKSLNRKEDLSKLKARALNMDPALEAIFANCFEAQTEQAAEEAGHAFDSPFAELKEQERLIDLYCSLFKGREDCFARQWSDKKQGKQGYVPVRRPMDKEDVSEHLYCRKTYGIYLLTKSSKVCLGVLDADIKKVYLQSRLKNLDRQQFKREQSYLLQRIPELGRKQSLDCLVEFSGHKGYHFWFFFESPEEAGMVKKVLEQLISPIKNDLSCFNLEVFPKQENLSGKGLGNLVKLPLGVHRLSGKKSYFLSVKNKELWSQLKVLDKLQKSSLSSSLAKVRSEGAQKQVLTHPRHEQWQERFPELALLQERCPALGQIFSSCRQYHKIDLREEKVLLGTLGFLTRRSTLLHHLFQNLPEYNPHYVDLKISQIRGTVLGCKKIHDLLGLKIDFCQFENPGPYKHPLLHCPDYWHIQSQPAEKVDNLQQALEMLQKSLDQVYKFMPKPKV